VSSCVPAEAAAAGLEAVCDPVFLANMTNVTPPRTLFNPLITNTDDLKAVGWSTPASANSSPVSVW